MTSTIILNPETIQDIAFQKSDLIMIGRAANAIAIIKAVTSIPKNWVLQSLINILKPFWTNRPCSSFETNRLKEHLNKNLNI